MKSNTKKWRILIVTLLLLNIAACSTTNPVPEDPFEGFNRKIYVFNRTLDKVVVRPVAKGYDFIMPDPAQKGVTNFFNNLGEIPNVANDILQVNIPWTIVDFWRFTINSTVGIVGLFDVASKMGLPKHKQDFGLTLKKWGYKNSAYLMLPILGPSTIRDTIGIPVNSVFCVTNYIDPWEDALAIEIFSFINTRANLLDTDRLIDEAFDSYVFVRDAYLQNREYKSKHSGEDIQLPDDQNNNTEATQNGVDQKNQTTTTTKGKKLTKEQEAKKHKEGIVEEYVPYSPL